MEEQKDNQIPPAPTPNPAPPAPVPAPAPAEAPAAPEKQPIDIDAILLPKKGVPASTQRVNAGELLAQEQNATLQPQEPAATAPVPQKPPQEKSDVVPLQTFRGDIESVVETQNVSVVSIAAAEAQARGKKTLDETPEEKSDRKKRLRKNIIMVASGIMLLLAAAGLAAVVFLVPRGAAVPAPTAAQAPFIRIDSTKVVLLPAQRISRLTLMEKLDTARRDSLLSLGLIERLVVAQASTTSDGKETQILLTAQEFLSVLAPNIPAELSRSFAPQQYLLGVHAYDENQAFLLFRTDSYQQAYSGMLDWERTMRAELLPLFARTPPLRAGQEPNASTTQQGTSTPPSQAPLQTGFVDRVVENTDARVIENQYGDILLLWAFLDRNTIIITTTESTLREAISRRTESPLLIQ